MTTDKIKIGNKCFTVENLINSGYRVISNKHGIIARIDSPYWFNNLGHLPTKTKNMLQWYYHEHNFEPSESTKEMLDREARTQEDHYRRCYSMDRIEGVPFEIIQALPNSTAEITGFVKKEFSYYVFSYYVLEDNCKDNIHIPGIDYNFQDGNLHLPLENIEYGTLVELEHGGKPCTYRVVRPNVNNSVTIDLNRKNMVLMNIFSGTLRAVDKKTKVAPLKERVEYKKYKSKENWLIEDGVLRTYKQRWKNEAIIGDNMMRDE